MKRFRSFRFLFFCCLMMVCILLFGTGTVCAESFESAAQEAEKKAEWIVENYTDPSMTQTKIARILHDWLIYNTYYDYTYSRPDRGEASGVLLNGTGVCDGYSKAYILLLSKAGIEALRVTGYVYSSHGTIEPHAWNLVQLDGKWYQVDVTWDDPTDKENLTAKRSGLENAMYFRALKRVMNERHFPDAESAELIETLIGDDENVELPEIIDDKNVKLPESVDISADHELSGLHLVTEDNQDLTTDSFSGKTIILVYGTITCRYTREFLSDISPYLDFLSRRGIQVVVALFSNPSAAEMKSFAALFPGIVCAKWVSDDCAIWFALKDFGYTEDAMVTPVIFLKNARNRLTYYSTDYVEKPLRILSGALKMQRAELPVNILLPDDLTVIGAEAFRGAAFSVVRLGKNTVEIGAYAFADNLNLQLVSIPASVTKISPSAFSGCSGNLVISGKPGSAAEVYAEEYGYIFEIE